MCSCKVLNTVIDNIFFGKRNGDFVWQFEYTSNHNQFETCIVTRVLNLIVSNDSVKVLNTFKHLNQRGRIVWGAGLAFQQGKMLLVQIWRETSSYFEFSLPFPFLTAKQVIHP